MSKYFVIVLLCVWQIGLNIAELPTMCPEIVTKQGWNGSAAVAVDYLIVPVKNIIIHHTVSEECSSKEDCGALLRNIQDFHIDSLDYDDIGYNFLIGGDGRVYEGAGWHKKGAHTFGYNSRSLGIAFIGDYTSKLPSPKMTDAAQSLIKCGVEIGEIDQNYVVFGARQVSATASPGNKFYREELRKWPHYTSSP